jgi:hypothetical protein
MLFLLFDKQKHDVYIVFFCSTFNSSNHITLPDTDMCWENVGVTRIGAYRIFLVSLAA